MPIYDYKCKHCQDTFEVTKRIADADVIESCPHCETACDKTCRIIYSHEFYGEKPEEPFYSAALGKMVKGKNDLRRKAKEKGWVEIGNEDINKTHDSYERDRVKRDNDRYREIYDPGAYRVRGV